MPEKTAMTKSVMKSSIFNIQPFGISSRNGEKGLFTSQKPLKKARNKGSFFIFSIGTFLGGAYEYLCSVITEIAFGTVFWDYSAIPFNLGGRINLLYCFFCGLASVVWIQIVYPMFSRLVEKIPVKPGKVITWLLAIFMVCDMAVSAAALVRYQERSEQIPATNVVQEVLDTYYGDAVMERIYPNAISVK